PFDESADLIVGQLSLMVNQGTAIMVACPNRPFEHRKCLIKTLVSKMSDIQYNSQSVHFPQQFHTGRMERGGHPGTVGITTRAVVSRAQSPQTVLIGFFQIG